MKRLKYLRERCEHMKTPTELEMIIDKILSGTHTDEEWLELEADVKSYLKDLPNEQKDYFAQSGAGEALYMICSGIRYDSSGGNKDVIL